jgi:hypothetical protein
MRVWLVVLSLTLAAAVALVVACQDGIDDHPCSNVPPGGCPLSHGVACDDPSCQAVYACEPGGAWRFDHACAARDGGSDAAPDAPRDTGRPPSDASALDVPPGAYGGPGCADLEPPDCPLGVALSCNDCCGCEDLFVCANGSWSAWGACVNGVATPAH